MISEPLLINHRIRIPAWEWEFTWARSSGPGGQAVNKVNSKAVLRWNLLASPSLPDDVKQRFLERFPTRVTKEGFLILTSDEFRDRRQNQRQCMEKLRSLLLAVASPPKKRVATKPSRSARERRHEEKRTRASHKVARRRVKDWE
ncbi:MAG: aminoacyl-tRNA hydrolase [Bdellovibrionales bacterium]|nr:aminoacyl-tRNA hydrolase [Bdellovibrionales bacterium]